MALVAPAQAAGHDDEAYLRFADRVAARLEPAWSPADGHYLSGTLALDSRFNAAMLLVHATAARYGHVGASRNDERARQLAQALTRSPPFFTGAAAPWADPMYHSPGWLGNLVPGYSMMDKAIDPKVAEGLIAAWQARDALALSSETAAAIVDEVSAVAHGTFFRYPNVRLNQINWPLEIAAYDAIATGRGELLRDEYRLQVSRFLGGVRRPWIEPVALTTTNLSPATASTMSLGSRQRGRSTSTAPSTPTSPCTSWRSTTTRGEPECPHLRAPTSVSCGRGCSTRCSGTGPTLGS